MRVHCHQEGAFQEVSFGPALNNNFGVSFPWDCILPKRQEALCVALCGLVTFTNRLVCPNAFSAAFVGPPYFKTAEVGPHRFTAPLAQLVLCEREGSRAYSSVHVQPSALGRLRRGVFSECIPDGLIHQGSSEVFQRITAFFQR